MGVANVTVGAGILSPEFLEEFKSTPAGQALYAKFVSLRMNPATNIATPVDFGVYAKEQYGTFYTEKTKARKALAATAEQQRKQPGRQQTILTQDVNKTILGGA